MALHQVVELSLPLKHPVREPPSSTTGFVAFCCRSAKSPPLYDSKKAKSYSTNRITILAEVVFGDRSMSTPRNTTEACNVGSLLL